MIQMPDDHFQRVDDSHNSGLFVANLYIEPVC